MSVPHGGVSRGMTFASHSPPVHTGAAMEKKEDAGLQGTQKTQGVWERRTVDRRWGQNQLFGSFRVDSRVDSGVRPVTQSDPTDDALAAIASILEKPNERPVQKPVDRPDVPSPESAESEISAAAEAAPELPPPATEPAAVPPPLPPAPPPIVDEYVKLGPGPLDAIRFKWTARPAGDGLYFVDETIGTSSRAMTSGPISKDEAIRLVDERERDARRRFDALKSEMTGQPSATDRKEAGENLA
jgi:hypothetical protein